MHLLMEEKRYERRYLNGLSFTHLSNELSVPLSDCLSFDLNNECFFSECEK